MIKLLLACLAALPALIAPAQAADKVRFLTSWFAEPEQQAGFYEAKATGLYDKAGLDVTIRMGGPQLNTIQLLVAGEADFIIGYDFQMLTARAHGLPVVTVATSFQTDIAGILVHDDVASLDALKGKPIAIGAASRLTFWPWLRQKFGYTDEQIRPYAFSMQPFFADPSLSQQGYLTFEPYVARATGREDQVLPALRLRLRSLFHDDRHHRRVREGTSRYRRALRQGLARRLARLPQGPGAGQQAGPGRQPEDERCRARLCRRGDAQAPDRRRRRRRGAGHRHHDRGALEEDRGFHDRRQPAAGGTPTGAALSRTAS